MGGAAIAAVVGTAIALGGATSGTPEGTQPAAPATSPTDLAALVNPLAGTLGAGFPTVSAGVPFGMVQPGPDTTLPDQADPVDYVGYAYQDPLIRGFSLTHFDGAGIHIAGDLPFMPTTGTVSSDDPLANASPYSHAQETAQPGYYSVALARYDVQGELTATTRTAQMRLTYPRGQPANVMLYSSYSIDGSHPSSVTVVGDDELTGSMTSSVGYPLYFVARFDRPFASFGTFGGSTLSPGSRATSGSSNGAWVSFDTAADPAVTMSVAVSYVDLAGAEHNLAVEDPPSLSFDAERAQARDDWDRHLADAVVGGGDPGMRQTFYSNLYRTLEMPTIFDDADGRYLGLDRQIHTVAAGHHHYSSLSEWDVYRSQYPLLELIEPGVAHDAATSLLDDYDANHDALPRWVEADVDRSIMGGDSATPIVADAVMNGLLTGTQAQRAYSDLRHQATTLPPVFSREHLDAYLQKRYIGEDVSGIGAAETLEYAIDDSTVAQVAQRLGHAADARAFDARAEYWRNLMDPTSRFLRPRDSDGAWADPTTAGPATVPWSPDFQDGYQEGTGWQYEWFVPQDVAGLADAIGGTAATLGRLDTFFSTPLNQALVTAVPTAQQYESLFGVYYVGDQYTPANEPDLWAPWYYDWLGQPYKTQRVVRAEMGVYNDRPDGLPGNDDAGEMSAWYVLAALGLYHVTPGVPAWELNSPAFSSESLRVGDGHTLLVLAPGAGAAEPYVQTATLGRSPLTRTFLTTCELRSGATLDFTLSPLPSNWATGAGAAPPSLSRPSPALVAACERG